ncbi:hypothetical protein I316_02083 [Kwoniella heveanensis BCC8398]|uniref:Capsular associated protein n=1 Tax=Kwoniella heveanensis BCC8398 TaxID=1296120 RepID=A0A1B9GYV4_9TREE|nr:hypothetical protein I316_02083 [Kwoniella heveanensis BCC8398]
MRSDTSADLEVDEEEEIESLEEDDESEGETAPPSYASSASGHVNFSRKIDPVFCLFVVIGIGWALGLLLLYPFPTTIPVFVGFLVILFSWTVLKWSRLIYALARRKEGLRTIYGRYSTRLKTFLILSTIFLSYMASLGLIVPREETPILPTEINGVHQKYFIAANLHDNEAVLARWSDQLVQLAFHLGRDNVYVSIYESNSRDRTKSLLSVLNTTLTNLSISHRIVTAEDNKHWWPYQTSSERIAYLASARNKALEPIQSADDDIRISNWEGYTKVLFLNDIWYSWQSMARLLDTKVEGEEDEEYDQACAMDFFASGLYDTWAARDICGTPLRVFWPYVKDSVTIDKIRKEEPFRVSSCWNGAVALKAAPFLYRRDGQAVQTIRGASEGTSTSHTSTDGVRNAGREEFGQKRVKRGWKMVDNSSYPISEFSPPLTVPLQFRTSNISACDHSECFLIGYDLHRLSASSLSTTHSNLSISQPGSGIETNSPRIYMNPSVKVAYEQNWYRWHNVILRIPVIKWWLRHWSRGYPLMFVDWIWEHFGRRRDYCTWAALSWNMPDRCPPLPGAIDRSWEQ